MGTNFNFKNLEELTRFFGITIKNLRYIRDNKYELLRKISVPKKRGGVRVVHQIKDDVFRVFVKKLNYILNDYANPSSSVHGFIKGRSCFTNASQHVNQNLVLNIDIKDFFQSIKIDRIIHLFQDMGFNKKHAKVLSELITINNTLATGFSTSPTISNIICLELDTDFAKLAKKHNATYTRYADDITFSSNHTVPNKEDISSILNKYDFSINYKKYKLQKRGGAQYVTGLTVCDKKPNIPRRTKKNLRLELYYMKKFGTASHFIYHVQHSPPYATPTQSKLMFGKVPSSYTILGWIAYANSIDKKFAHCMINTMKEVRTFTKLDTLLSKSKKSQIPLDI